MDNYKRKKRSKIWIYFSLVIFFTFMITTLLLVLFSFFLYKAGVLSINPLNYHLPLLSQLCVSLFIGAIVAAAATKVFIRPIRKLGEGFAELSKGNFDVRVPTNAQFADIREIAEGFNTMAYDLGHVETLRSDFVASVSHEFKTPLSAIEGYVTLLQNPRLSREKHDHYVEKILTNTHRLINLSSNILTLSKLENQETVLHKKEYLLDEQLRKSVLLLEEKWTAKNLDFDIELEEQPFYGNENLLDQVWFNLLDNAIKHSPKDGTIAVSITKTSDKVSVTVTDRGEGMTEEIQKHIFEKFYQGDSSHKAEGNGLGLALVKRIVELCQGTITVQSEPQKGASFTVSLPIE